MTQLLFFISLPIDYDHNAHLENIKKLLLHKNIICFKNKINNDSVLLQPILKDIKHPVVFIANGIGDGFLALPTIRALALSYPYQLIIIYDNIIPPVWLYDLPLKAIILIEVVKKEHNIIFDFEAVAKTIDQCDLFISLNFGEIENIRILSNLLNPEYSIGFDKHFNFTILQDPNRHAFQTYFEVLKLIDENYDIKNYNYSPEILKTDHLVVDRLMEYVNKNYNDSLKIAIHTDTQPNKMWHDWGKFIDLTLEKFPSAVLFVLGSSYEFEIQDKRIFDFTRFPFSISIGLLSHCDIFIGIDSCLLHVADLLNIIGIGLFFSSDPKIYGFHKSKQYMNIQACQFNKIDPLTVIDAISSVININLTSRERII